MQFPCPHCSKLSAVVHSKVISPVLTRAYLQCKNLNCGHTWSVDVEASATIDPSACPNEAVKLEISPMAERERKKLKAQADQPGDLLCDCAAPTATPSAPSAPANA